MSILCELNLSKAVIYFSKLLCGFLGSEEKVLCRVNKHTTFLRKLVFVDF